MESSTLKTFIAAQENVISPSAKIGFLPSTLGHSSSCRSFLLHKPSPSSSHQPYPTHPIHKPPVGLPGKPQCPMPGDTGFLWPSGSSAGKFICHIAKLRLKKWGVETATPQQKSITWKVKILTSWWFQLSTHLKNMLVKLDHFPRDIVENSRTLVTVILFLETLWLATLI